MIENINVLKFAKLINEIEIFSTKIIKNSGKILKIIRDKNTSKNLIPELIKNCSDSLAVNGGTSDFVKAILYNDFSYTTVFFKEIWFGDLYESTGITAIEDFVHSLKANVLFTVENLRSFEDIKISSKDTIDEIKKEAPQVEEEEDEKDEENEATVDTNKLLELY